MDETKTCLNCGVIDKDSYTAPCRYCQEYVNWIPAIDSQKRLNYLEDLFTAINNLADLWCDKQPSPHDDAYSDLPLEVRIIRSLGWKLKKTIYSSHIKERVKND